MISKKYFKTRFTFDEKRNTVWIAVTKYLQRYISRNSSILDLGAGYCTFINNIKAKEKHALDIFDELKQYANEDVITHNTSSANMKGLKQGHFDVVFASNFFEHLKKEDLNLTLKEIRRVLKKNGRLILIQPNFKYGYKNYFDDYTHETIHTDASMADMLKGFGFKIEKNIPKFLPFSLKSKLPTSKFLITAYLHSPFKPFAQQMLIIARKLE